MTRLVDDERAISAGMSAEQVRDVFRGAFDPSSLYTEEVLEFPTEFWAQHAGVMENFAANILDGTPAHRTGHRRHHRRAPGQRDPPVQLAGP